MGSLRYLYKYIEKNGAIDRLKELGMEEGISFEFKIMIWNIGMSIDLKIYKKVGCADWILSGRLSCYSGNIAGNISGIITKRRKIVRLRLLLLCAGHGTVLAGESPATGIYRQV